MIVFAQSVPNNSPLDLDQIGKEYGKNAVNADLLYKGKILTVRGKVVSIGNGSVYKGMVGSVRFKSYIVNGGNSWSCAFDAHRVEDIAKIRKDDFVVFSGQLVSFLNFHHCTLISDVAADAMFAGVVFGEKGDGVLAPTVLFAPDPEYSDKARKNKIQGTCGLSLVVGSDGHTRDITVIRPLEPSLDENAVETVKTWRFRPATKYEVPVAVRIKVDVRFQLLQGPNPPK
jgi:TonB family protein